MIVDKIVSLCYEQVYFVKLKETCFRGVINRFVVIACSQCLGAAGF